MSLKSFYLQIISESEFTVTEGGEPRYISVYTGLPPSLLCALSGSGADCDIRIEGYFSPHKSDFKCYDDGKKYRLPQAVLGWEGEGDGAFCGVPITAEGIGRTLRIAVRAKLDMRRERRTAVRTLRVFQRHYVAGVLNYEMELIVATVSVVNLCFIFSNFIFISL